jgi:hypothetical protein
MRIDRLTWALLDLAAVAAERIAATAQSGRYKLRRVSLTSALSSGSPSDQFCT